MELRGEPSLEITHRHDEVRSHSKKEVRVLGRVNDDHVFHGRLLEATRDELGRQPPLRWLLFDG